MKPRHLLITAFLAICLFSSCTGGNKEVTAQQRVSSIRDSVLIYKIQGLKAFIKEADYWGSDTESYWAYGQADSILDCITDYSQYEESLARIYSATSYVFYGLSYVPSVMAECRQHYTGKDESSPKVGLEESTKIVIRDSLSSATDTISSLLEMEIAALFSTVYLYKAIEYVGFEERVLPNLHRGEQMTKYTDMSEETEMKLYSVCNMQAWYNLIIMLTQMSHYELHGKAADLETMPWKEFIELAHWHDALTENPQRYETISDEEFHKIEVKAAYTQYIMMKHIAENLAKLKEKRHDNYVFAEEQE